ncbi:DUF4174 domain-containing protein [Flavobacterium sp. W21_SRS_FM6]|uniref:DUF4174 domain-containing protein n=1 Tax=Flavobacterium sp. W21_SRS_FM6 TaxID=3240268 RepID=UPI003F8F3E1A
MVKPDMKIPRNLSAYLCLCTASFSFNIANAQPQTIDTLEALAWQNRLILLNGSVLPKETMTLLATEDAAIAEREIVWFWLDGEQLDSNFISPLSITAKQQIRNELISSNVVLIGKDGGIKLRRQTFTLAEVLQRIDSMPMRQQEMQKHN